jgi:lipopolysaccharide transport system permease protein
MLTTQQTDLPRTRIAPTKGWISLNLRELWEYQELLYFFVWKDLKVRYKQTILGVLWAILQPVLTMVIFTLVFGKLAGLSSDDLPYPIFNFSALVPWAFFQNALINGSNSLVINANMLKKIYFPRITLPIATVLAGLVDFALAFIILIGMMFYYGRVPTLNVLWLPLFLLLALMTSLGVTLWLSAMNVKFRDIRYTIPFLAQAWLFITPIAYSSSLFEEPWKTIYGLNPMVGVVEGFRWALLGTETTPGIILLSSFVAFALFISGAFYFRRMEKDFADIA